MIAEIKSRLARWRTWLDVHFMVLSGALGALSKEWNQIPGDLARDLPRQVPEVLAWCALISLGSAIAVSSARKKAP